MIDPPVIFAQQQGVRWDTLQGLLASLGLLVLFILAAAVVLSYLRRRLFEDKKSVLDDDDITLGQARRFLRRRLINQEEFERLREKIVERSRRRLFELDEQGDEPAAGNDK